VDSTSIPLHQNPFLHSNSTIPNSILDHSAFPQPLEIPNYYLQHVLQIQCGQDELGTTIGIATSSFRDARILYYRVHHSIGAIFTINSGFVKILQQMKTTLIQVRKTDMTTSLTTRIMSYMEGLRPVKIPCQPAVKKRRTSLKSSCTPPPNTTCKKFETGSMRSNIKKEILEGGSKKLTRGSMGFLGEASRTI
jgi:hypothetical protein